VVSTSQPRYSNENSTTFWQYTTPSNPLYRRTDTAYDFLGRVIRVTPPSTTATTTSYPLGTFGVRTQTIDGNGNCTRREHDTLGRLRQVVEYLASGCASSSATTNYSYDPLDQLTGVTDAVGNATSMAYDSVGRKTTMTDPDMGTWYYDYDANGTLRAQVDARGIPTTFSYDEIDRLTSQQAADVGNTLFGDTFSTQSMTNWTWSGHQTVPYNDGGAQVLRTVGTGNSWAANVMRPTYDLTSGDGVRLRFKVDNLNSNATFALEAAGSPYRRFGVVANGGIV
jgi:YD repeat-containing protein